MLGLGRTKAGAQLESEMSCADEIALSRTAKTLGFLWAGGCHVPGNLTADQGRGFGPEGLSRGVQGRKSRWMAERITGKGGI